MLHGFENGETANRILTTLISDHRFKGLAEVVEITNAPGKRITRESKRAVRRRELLKAALRCPLCHARIPSSDFSDDHVIRAQDGGRGDPSNDQLTHPYCNSGFKEHLASCGKEPPKRPAFLEQSS